MTTTQTQWMPTAPQQPAPRNGRATAGFSLGLLGLFAGLVPFFGFLVTVPALLLSRAGRTRFRSGATATPGLSGGGIVLAWIGTALCAVMTIAMLAGLGQPAQGPVQPAAAPAPAPVPALLGVPNLVGMGDLQARDVLRAAGFTNVVLGPSTGPQAGVAAGTVTTQLPGAAAFASAGDPIVLGEAAEPPAPAPVLVPQAAPTTDAAPATQAARPFVADPDVDVDRPYVPAPRVAAGSSGGGSAYYKNCAAARNAGAAPLHRGDPGYSGKLDRDGDGIACE